MVENNQKLQQKPQQSGIDKMTGFYKRVSGFGKQAFYKLSNLEKSNMELAIRQLKKGEFFDAAMRFKFVLLLNKNNSIAQYLLGKSYFFAGKFDKAAAPLKKAIAARPDLDEARFLLAACGGDITIKSIPRSFIIEKLDFISTRYEAFVEGTSSVLNNILAEEFKKIIGENMGFNVLDLGCRGGDSAQILRPISNAVVGVEPSLKMVAIARTRRINDLLTFNLIATKFPEDFMKECKDKFAVVISTYYLDNLGDLKDYFHDVHNLLEKGGLFAFNISRDLELGTNDYAFKSKTLIFSHSASYIKKLADNIGFNIASEREATYSSGAVDLVYILEKK